MRNNLGSRTLRLAAPGSLIAVAASLGLLGSAQAEAIVAPSPGADPPSVCDAIAGNLVVNCGFESGSLAPGWTALSMGGFASVTGNPHSGNNAASFAGRGSGSISQTISTIAGDTYNITFWLTEQQGSVNFVNQFIANFGSANLLSVSFPSTFPYTEFSQNAVATSASTALTFSGSNLFGTFFLDDISVVLTTAVPEPASLALLGSALFGFGVIRRRKPT